MSKQQRQQKDVPMTKNDTWYLLIVEQTCCDCVENRVNQRKKNNMNQLMPICITHR